MEEKILLPATRRWRGGQPLAMAAKLRLDHDALAALLVPMPRPSVVAAIRTILKDHNVIEDGPGGLYEQCEEFAGAEAHQIFDALHNAPEVRVAPHNDGPNVIEATRRALARGGYDLQI